MAEDLLVTNIQRMCMHDGPGLRTTVFLKGCSLYCPWCANPENIHFGQEKYVKDGKIGIYGKCYTDQELLQEIVKDRKFWKSGGGVTFSGGEPLAHMERLESILQWLTAEKIHVAMETSLHVDTKMLKRSLPYTNLYLVDVKILIPSLCKDILGGDVNNYYYNLDLLHESGKPIIFRVPCNREYTVTSDNLELIRNLFRKYSEIPVEIFETHSLGKPKYESLGLRCREWEKISCGEMKHISQIIGMYGNKITINML